MLQYTLRLDEKNQGFLWGESGSFESSSHSEKLTQLKVDLEGMMVMSAPPTFVMRRLKALHAAISDELGEQEV